jgi:hypothetical protein
LLNKFGAGRSEVNIGGISSKKLSYNIDTIQPLSEFNSKIKTLTFIQGSLFNSRKRLSLSSPLDSTPRAIFTIGISVEVLEKVLLKQWVNWVFIIIYVIILNKFFVPLYYYGV